MGSFDHIDHERLLEMRRVRRDDRPCLRRIKKWFKAGVFDTDGQVLHPVTGLPQGGIVSPILANIDLHPVLDGWLTEVVQAHCQGQAILCRYADDGVCAFQYERDAERFSRVLGKRLGTYGRELSPEKTRLLGFSRHQRDVKSRLDFLGFSLYGARTAKARIGSSVGPHGRGGRKRGATSPPGSNRQATSACRT